MMGKVKRLLPPLEVAPVFHAPFLNMQDIQIHRRPTSVIPEGQLTVLCRPTPVPHTENRPRLTQRRCVFLFCP